MATDIRVGDEWVFLGNNGGISRTITYAHSTVVCYRRPGDPYEYECARKTFDRWVRGARLEFATDWTGR